jgi:hypothetical protein
VLASDPSHFFSCTRLRRTAITQRHNQILHLLAKLVRMVGGATYIEPDWFDGKRPDLQAYFPDARYLLDVSVTHPSAPSYQRLSAFKILHAAVSREKRKDTKYGAMSLAEDSKFVPFLYWNLTGVWVERLESSLKCLHRLPLHTTLFQTSATMPIAPSVFVS